MTEEMKKLREQIVHKVLLLTVAIEYAKGAEKILTDVEKGYNENFQFIHLAEKVRLAKLSAGHCVICAGKGYTEYESGVTDSGICEIMKEPCECVLSAGEESE